MIGYRSAFGRDRLRIRNQDAVAVYPDSGLVVLVVDIG